MKIIGMLSLFFLLSGCQWWLDQYDDGGIPTISSQRQADAYNATVSSPGEMLVCGREAVIGSNIREFVCMTVAQRDRMAREAQEALREVRADGVIQN